MNHDATDPPIFWQPNQLFQFQKRDRMHSLGQKHLKRPFQQVGVKGKFGKCKFFLQLSILLDI